MSRLLVLWLLRRLGLRMPGVYAGPNFGGMLQAIVRRIRALETQQNMVLTNGLGQPVIVMGSPVPGTNPPQYGLQFVNPATGAPLMFVGETTTAGVTFYDNTGDIIMQITGTEIAFPTPSGAQIVLDALGLHGYDSSGTEQVRVGELSSSPAVYGLGVLPYGGGALQRVGGVSQATGSDVTNVTSTSPVPVPSSLVTVELGPSGQAQVTVNTEIATGGGGQEGFCAVSIDDGSPGGGVIASGGSAVNSSTSSTRVYSGLAPGVHTFSLAVWVGGASANCSFYGPTIIVQPL